MLSTEDKKDKTIRDLMEEAVKAGSLPTVIKILNDIKDNKEEQSKLAEVALWIAISKGHLNIVQHVVSVGINKNLFSSKTGLSPILYAVSKMRKYFVTYMSNLRSHDASALKDGIYLEKTSDNKIKGVFLNDNNEVIEYIFDINVEKNLNWDVLINNKSEILKITAEKGHTHTHLKIAKHLIDAGFNLNLQTFKDKTTPLILAASEAKWDILKYLANHGADVNLQTSGGFTALMFSAGYGKYDVVKYLVEEKGANVELKNKYGQTAIFATFGLTTFKLKDTKVETSILFPNLNIVKYLANKVADIDLQDNDGYTILMFLSNESFDEDMLTGDELDDHDDSEKKTPFRPLKVIKYIVEKKEAKLDIQNNKGETALMIAVSLEQNCRALVQYLVDKGANINIQNNKDETALMITISRKCRNYLDLLKAKPRPAITI